jgi:hypothetical protein
MAYKLIDAAQDRWRALNAPQLVASSATAPPSSTDSSSNDPTRSAGRSGRSGPMVDLILSG